MQIPRGRQRFVSAIAVDIHSYLAVVQDRHMDRTAGAIDMQGVLRLTRSMGNCNRCARSILKLQRRYCGVLDLASENLIRNKALDMPNRAEQVCKYLKAMAAEVDHRAAAAFFLLHEPVPRVARFRIEILERIDLCHRDRADLAVSNDLFYTSDRRIEPAIVRYTEHYIVRSTGGDHLVAFFQIERHRFFAEDVLSRFGRRDRLLAMEKDGRRNVDGIDLRIGDQLTPVRKPFLRRKLFSKLCSEFSFGTTDRDKLTVLQIADRRCYPLSCNIAGPDQSPSDNAHQNSRLSAFAIFRSSRFRLCAKLNSATFLSTNIVASGDN